MNDKLHRQAFIFEFFYNKLIVAKMIKNSSSSPSIKSIKPTMVCCYICGQQFGSKSFSIHKKSCEDKFHNQQKLKNNPKQKISLPKGPEFLEAILSGNYDSNTLKIYNLEAFQIYKYKILPKCKYCARTFKYQSLIVHEKGCDKKSKTQITPDIYSDYMEEKIFKKPKTLLCCVCGRQCGTASLKIHYPQCLQKFNKNEYMRCPNPKDRRRPPQFSEQQVQLINTKQSWTNQQIQDFYKAATQKFRNQSLMQCYNCKRKFQPESIQKHEKNCVLINGNKNPELHLKKVQSQKVLHMYEKEFKKPKTLMCYICGRQFGLTSLTIHQKSCFQKFKIYQSNKPKTQRKILPLLPKQIEQGDFNILKAQDWQMQKIQTYNQLISQTYNKKTLTTCYICERTFVEQSLVKHIVHCENNLQKLKFKIGRSQHQTKTLIRCESIKKTRQIKKSVDKLIPKPRVLMCHICGRQFGLTSLPIHLKVCPEKFQNEQIAKQKQKRKPLPELSSQLKTPEYDIKTAPEWSNQKIEFYNKIVYEVFNKKALQTCYLCERTFFEESLQKHFKYCQKYTLERLQKLKKSDQLSQKQLRILSKHKQILKQKQMKQSQYFATVQKTKPKSLTCHVCGRGYGLTSLQIHLPNCVQKFVVAESKKPILQRKIIPSIQNQLNAEYFDISTSQDWSRQKIDSYNQACSRVYKQKSLTKCEYCRRTFQQEQFLKHAAFCQKQNLKALTKSKQMGEASTTLLKKSKSAKDFEFVSLGPKVAQKIIRQPKILVCHVCGRQFGLLSLKIHLPQCEQKFQKQESLKPQEIRKKLPQLSQTQKQAFDIQKAQQWSSQQIRQYNQICTKIYRTKSLQICKYCGRSFFQEQLPKHFKFCEKQALRKLKKNQSVKQTLASSEENITEHLQKHLHNQEQSLVFDSPKKNVFEDNIRDVQLVMSIIRQEQIEHSVSPVNKETQRLQKMPTLTKSFSIFPIEIQELVEDQEIAEEKESQTNEKQNSYAKSHVFQQQATNQSNPIKQFLKPINTASLQIENNKSSINLSLKRQSISMKAMRSSSDLNKTQNQDTKPRLTQNQDRKQCQLCKKKVKNDLYDRHLKMCKSNTKMTGNFKRQTPKHII